MDGIDKNEIVQKYGQKVSSLAHRMIWNPELAQEAAQEVWYEVIKSLDSFKRESEISTWIYTIAKRTILKFIKSERVLKTFEYEAHFNARPIEYFGEEEETKQWVKDKCDYCLTAFCHCLTNEARLIFLFRDLVELDDVQISEIMEMSQTNVRKIASRSKQKVKHFMDKDCVLVNADAKCRCRIQKQVRYVELDKEYQKLRKGVSLIDLFEKFDKDLPRKNYWLKIIQEDVTA